MAEEKKYTLDELKEKLKEKECIFCHQYIIDWNGSRAARDAGYSEKTCAEIAYENLRKPHIRQYIDFIKNDFEKESGISKLRNLQELAKIAYSSIAHLHNSWVTRKEYDDLTEDQKACIESIKTRVHKLSSIEGDEPVFVEQVEIKLFPKIPAMQEINKMMGYNEPEKVDVTTKINVSLK